MLFGLDSLLEEAGLEVEDSVCEVLLEKEIVPKVTLLFLKNAFLCAHARRKKLVSESEVSFSKKMLSPLFPSLPSGKRILKEKDFLSLVSSLSAPIKEHASKCDVEISDDMRITQDASRLLKKCVEDVLSAIIEKMGKTRVEKEGEEGEEGEDEEERSSFSFRDLDYYFHSILCGMDTRSSLPR